MNEKAREYITRFEKGVERKGTDSVKWDNLKAVFGNAELLPLWVADTDFPCPDEVVEALRKKTEHGVYGYSFPTEVAYQTVIEKLKRDYNWNVEKEWILFVDGIVGGLYSSVEAYTKPEDSVLIQQPVYFPFAGAIKEKNRVLINNPLKKRGDRFEMDLEDLRKTLSEKENGDAVKLAILCNPHNPVGRVWQKDELEAFGSLCEEHQVVVVSDEIHCDILLNQKVFTPFAAISKNFEQNSITFMAASKTYNVAGFHQSFAIIPNPELRKKFASARCGMNWGNGFGLKALEVAYKFGGDYKEALNTYIWDNYLTFRDYLKEKIPTVSVIEPEGTYLIWVDFTATGLTEEEVWKRLIEDCQVGVNLGSSFGNTEGVYMRFNLGCSRENLFTVLERMEKVFGKK